MSPDIMFAWYFWSILILFFLFQINLQFLIPPKYISFITENKVYKIGRMRLQKRAHVPFFGDFILTHLRAQRP